MTHAHHLPDNSTALEQELAALSGAHDGIPVDAIETIWDAWRAPAPLLPWLAWAVSVDLWDDAWDEVRKRRAIAESPAYHEIKGTRGAVETALDLLQRPYVITEWFNQSPPARRGTSRVFIEADELGGLHALMVRARPLVAASKPKSRAVALSAGQSVGTRFVVGFGVLLESVVTVEPYSYAGEDAAQTIVAGVGVYRETLTTIQSYARVGETIAGEIVAGVGVFLETLTTVQPA